MSAPACVTRTVFPQADAAHSSILEITVLLDRCRVLPVLGDHLVPLEALALPGALAGVNGGYFDDHARPVGWRRIGGIDRAPAWGASLGGVLALDGARAYVGPRAQMPEHPESVVQSKPLLVERDGESGIITDDGRRAARTTVCVAEDGALHFVLFLAAAGDGPTLAEAADVLRTPRARGGFGCRSALNLDGGPSTGAWFAGGGAIPPRGEIVDALFVVPR